MSNLTQNTALRHAFQQAICQGNRAQVIKLHKQGASLEQMAGSSSPINYAILHQHHDVALTLLELGLDPTQHTPNPLIVAINHLQTKLYTPLVKAGINPNQEDTEGFNALTIAVHKNHEPSVRTLLKIGADANNTNYASAQLPLWHAIDSSYDNNEDICDLLLKKTRIPSEHYSNYYNTAVKRNRHNVLIHMLEKCHCDPNPPHRSGPNLHDILQFYLELPDKCHENDKTIQILLDHGANANLWWQNTAAFQTTQPTDPLTCCAEVYAKISEPIPAHQKLLTQMLKQTKTRHTEVAIRIANVCNPLIPAASAIWLAHQLSQHAQAKQQNNGVALK